MIYKRLKLTLCIVASLCWVEVSSDLFNFRLFDLDSGGFTSNRSRWTTSTRNGSPRSSINFESAPVLNFVGIVDQFGYVGEEHKITTIDGYNLKTHRISGSKTSPKTYDKPVVYFQHGLFGSSDMWVLLGPKRDLSYAFVEAGYDVWLGNVRGNTYSRSHVQLNPDYDPEFWEFSYHDIALHDVTANIDYILQKTGQKSLLYIGHSMGTTISYILLSTRPEYNKKIWFVVSLAPVAIWSAGHTPLGRFLVNNAMSIKNLAYNAKVHEIFPLTSAAQQLSRRFCGKNSMFRQMCINFYYFQSGYNPDQLDADILPYVFSYFPAGTSRKLLIHFSQNMKTGEFRAFDYGKTQNLATYGQPKAPLYDLKKITAPVALLFGKGDALVLPGNPLLLANILPNVETIEAIPHERFAHMDFIWAKDIKKLIINRVMNITSRVFKRVNFRNHV